MRHLFLALHAYLVGLAQKRELLQQVMPISHRYARLCSPCAAFVWAVYLALYSKLWQSLCPPNKSGPGRRQPTLKLFKYLAWFQMPSGHLTRAANVPNAQSRGGIGTYGTVFACLCHPLCPKSKWHVPPPAYGFAFGSYSQLCQSLSYAHQMGQSLSMTPFSIKHHIILLTLHSTTARHPSGGWCCIRRR